MGRTILAEERLQKFDDNLYKTESWSVGLIVGQQTPSRDYAVHMVRTPPQEDDDEVDLENEPQKPQRNLQTTTDVWIITHAKQVHRMLPGGLEIIGVFAMAPPAVMTAVQNKLKLILYSVQKMAQKAGGSITRSDDDVTERIMLHICPVTRKLTCRTYDMADSSGASKPADWKYQSFVDRWVTIATNVSMDIACRAPVEIMCQTLQKQIQNSVSDYCTNVWDSMVTINNRVLEPEASIAPPSGGDAKKSKKHAAAASAAREHKELYAEIYAPVDCNIPGIYTVDSGGMMVVRGTMSCRAYLNNRATFKDATYAIKRDVIRSILSRTELLCEDFASGEEQYARVVMETPQRVFAPYEGTPVCFCDYAFPDEKLFESKERFKDLLDLHVKEEEIDTTSESLPTAQDLAEAEQIPERPDLPHVKKRSQLKRTLTYMTGGLLAALAAGVSYMYLGDDSMI